MTELLSPAGSFESAVAAFNGGADAVYLGMSDFSARKGARNFTRDELLRLKSESVERKRKIFVTMNTVIKESEFAAALETVSFLNEIEIDALILQDIGLARAVKELFPDLSLHASTQMAVHTVEGAENIKNIGFSRVVLSRELPIEKIVEIRKKVPDIELEVFIHGALCYSFSGLCLASGMILDRSGNRGECAQICRSYYDMDGRDGYYFSCNDLVLKEKIRLLVDAGINSLKIEGRMKSPQYVFHTAALYRSILDNRDHTGFLKMSRISFSRKETTGYFSSFSGTELVNSLYPGHRGIRLGTCEKVQNGRFLIKLREPLSIRDGIMFFKGNDERHPVNCGVEEILTVSGKSLKKVASGERVFIRIEHVPQKEDTIFLTSSRDSDMKKVNPASFKRWKKKIDISVSIKSKKVEISCGTFVFYEEIDVEHSENRLNFINKFKDLFASSGDSLYTSGDVIFNETCENKFIPPQILKKIRNNFYEHFARHITREKNNKIDSFLNKNAVSNMKVPKEFAKRELLSPDNDIPFLLENGSLNDLKTIEGYLVIPLMPVMKNSTDYLNKVVDFIKKSDRARILLSVSNPGHFHLVKLLEKNSNVSFFIDFNLYIANRFTNLFLKELIGEKLMFGYYWIEDKSDNELENDPGIIKISNSFNPPLFISTGCFEKANNIKKCDKCNRLKTVRTLKNMDRTFKVVTVDCVTFMFYDPDR